MNTDSGDSRLRILLLYDLLQKYTDENHMLSTRRIMELMEREHGLKMHRTTLPRDMEILKAAGIDIMSEKKRTQYFYLGERKLSLPELRLLADAVLASRFITARKSEQLLAKLRSMTSMANAEKLRRVVHTTGKPKTDNEKGYYIIDAINEAMSGGKKISLYYCDYNIRKRRVRRNKGKPYTISPYDLIWDGDYYYLTGFCDERGEVRTFRVDRIEHRPTLLEDAAEPRPEDYRVERYTQEVFRMFANQDTETVTLLCDAEVMGAFIDRFGKSVKTKPVSDGVFRAEVEVCPGPTFYRWVFGWGGKIRIEAPERQRMEYKQMLAREIDRYGEVKL